VLDAIRASGLRRDYTGDEAAWFKEAVEREDFLDNKFLSDDERHSAAEIGTNIERAMASNATEGNIWQEFSSKTYKQLPPVQIKGLVDPLHPALTLLPMEAKGGRGYYRTPTLANVWATAPFFHNNALGLEQTTRRSVAVWLPMRDGMEKLLWPGRRTGLGTIRRTTRASTFQYPEGGSVCIAKNTPIDLITNVELVSPEIFRRDNFFTRIFCHLTGTGGLNALFLLNDNAPDFVRIAGTPSGRNCLIARNAP